ncbi:uncharacterized protein BX663DRAFT_550596 [Cokeromyces recurvatus]|uniref:uncharacterized protein n=1 Tax=Cokeromyces recurvatus TaxID=90255 RepID=UPI00221EA219|nr:uncharacterized protein BX663DRAFT_550596 [Cokeromyces recurvatus]KAI7904200.1 hypothetical protein BX663DRAFT_550596 [Cokeromyces recurvatus]
MNTIQVISNNPGSLLAFTLLTANNLLTCSTKPIIHDGRPLPPLKEFIQHLYSNNNSSSSKKYIPCSVKVFSLIYLLRLKSKLPNNARGGFDTPYRLLLAAILTSSKYLSETGTGLTSMHLSLLTDRIYTPKEINRMERSFLGLLRYDLWVSLEDIQTFMKLYGDIIQVDIITTKLLIPSFNSNHHTNSVARCLVKSNSSSNTTEINNTNHIISTTTTNTAISTTSNSKNNNNNTATNTATISPHPA